ncbi:MAG: metallophosphoesterase, partial [Candidatus Omnitrophica bacterium]|nr:metallophosphoesterase [Candidatus Omnitrophota bacterium]
MSILVINDPHTSDKPPRYRTASYNDDIFDKMDQAVRIGHENSVDFGVITGDLFHNPQAGKNSHLLVNRWMRFFYESELDWYILPGNHDLSAGRLASINKQPIGVLANHPNVTLLEDGVVHNTINDGRIVGIGWNYAMDAEYIKQRVPDDIDVLFIPIG